MINQHFRRGDLADKCFMHPDSEHFPAFRDALDHLVEGTDATNPLHDEEFMDKNSLPSLKPYMDLKLSSHFGKNNLQDSYRGVVEGFSLAKDELKWVVHLMRAAIIVPGTIYMAVTCSNIVEFEDRFNSVWGMEKKRENGFNIGRIYSPLNTKNARIYDQTHSGDRIASTIGKSSLMAAGIVGLTMGALHAQGITPEPGSLPHYLGNFATWLGVGAATGTIAGALENNYVNNHPEVVEKADKKEVLKKAAIGSYFTAISAGTGYGFGYAASWLVDKLN